MTKKKLFEFGDHFGDPAHVSGPFYRMTYKKTRKLNPHTYGEKVPKADVVIARKEYNARKKMTCFFLLILFATRGACHTPKTPARCPENCEQTPGKQAPRLRSNMSPKEIRNHASLERKKMNARAKVGAVFDKNAAN